MKTLIRKTVLALAMLSAIPAPASAAPYERGARCAAEVGQYSRMSSAMSDMTIVNRSHGIIYIYWINFHGQREYFGRLAPGQAKSVATYVGHAWVVSDGAENCQRVIHPPAGDYRYAYS